MPDYKKLYHKAYNAMTDAECLVSKATATLRAAQQECEEMYVAADDTPIHLLIDEKELENDGKPT